MSIFKKLIKSILRLIVIMLGYLFTIKFINTIKIYKNLFFSTILKREFKRVGKGFSIEYPFIVIGGKYISIGENFNSFSGLRLEAHESHLNNTYTPELLIGDNVSINYDCHIGCVNKINIGNNVLLASKIFITDHFHGEINESTLKYPPSLRKVVSRGPVIIEDNVWVGEGAAIMPGVTVGKNSIIGANAVVVKDIPPNSIVGGVPAKIIKQF